MVKGLCMHLAAAPAAFDPQAVFSEYQEGSLRVDFARRQVWLDGRLLGMTRKEWELLSLLLRHAGAVVARRRLLEEVWGYRPDIRTRTLDVHIQRLRKKLGPAHEHLIETIFGVGYRFQPPAEQPPDPVC